METESDSTQKVPVDPASDQPAHSPPQTRSNRLWNRLSPWYSAAIIVVGLAMLAKLYQDAPLMPPRSTAATALAPGVELRVTHPDRLGAPLRKADSVPVLVELLGSGAVTYTVALSTTTPMLFTDRSQEIAVPRAELSLDPCCQANVALNPLVPSAENLWWQPLTVTVYADEAGAASPVGSRIDFEMQIEPAWWTFLRRLLLLFADLGLAVAVALAFAGWAFDQQKQRDEQQKWEYQRREQHQQAVWQAQLAHVQQKCQHDLLDGVGELLKLRRRLADDRQDDSRRIEVDRLLESFQALTKSKDSLQHERVIEKAVSSLKSRHPLSEEQLEAVGYLLDRNPSVPKDEDQSTEESFRRLGDQAQGADPDIALDIVSGLYRRFAYSLAIRDLTVTTIRRWYEGKDPSREEVNGRLHAFRYLLHHPRLVDIPYSARSQLYHRSKPQQYRYSWARLCHLDAITPQLKGMLGIDVRPFHPVPPQRYLDLMPTSQPEQPPSVFWFPVHEDAEYGAHSLRNAFLDQQMDTLREIDGQLSQDSASSTVPTFVPFPVIVCINSDLDGTEQTEGNWLRQFAQALGEEWIKLLACNLLIWSGLSAQERNMLAALLCDTTGTEQDLRHRFLNASRCQETQLQPEKLDGQQPDREIIIGSLVRSIEQHAQSAGANPEPGPNRLEMWLTLRPPHMTHTVIVAVMPQFAGRQARTIWANATRLVKRLQSHNVLVHLLATQKPPHGFSSLAVEEMALSEVQLVKVFDNAFGHYAPRAKQVYTAESATGQCEIASLNRLLADGSSDITADFAEALLRTANGSPSRLLHIMYDVFVHRVTASDDESYGSKVAPSELMRVLQAYKKQTP